MSTIELNESIINGYIKLLESLSPNNKLELISKLSALVKTDLKDKTNSFEKSFGALDTSKSADEIIEEIRNTRVSTREIEKF